MSTAGRNDDHSTLIPEAVLPDQFFAQPRGSARTSGQVALMHAVLTDAIECYQKQFLARGRRIERIAKEAEEWLFDDDERWPFAFVNVCAALGMEPSYVRRGLRRARQRSRTQPKQKLRHVAPARRVPRIAA
jgi:hypothetical protein